MSLTAERVLSLAVERVIQNCKTALVEAKNGPAENGLHPLTNINLVNLDILTGAMHAADLVYDAEPRPPARQRSTTARVDPGTKVP